jgi:hypothetical protein
MQVDLSTMQNLRTGYAALALENPDMMLIFERIDADCADAEALAENDPVTLARRRLEARKQGRAA